MPLALLPSRVFPPTVFRPTKGYMRHVPFSVFCRFGGCGLGVDFVGLYGARGWGWVRCGIIDSRWWSIRGIAEFGYVLMEVSRGSVGYGAS